MSQKKSHMFSVARQVISLTEAPNNVRAAEYGIMPVIEMLRSLKMNLTTICASVFLRNERINVHHMLQGVFKSFLRFENKVGCEH